MTETLGIIELSHSNHLVTLPSLGAMFSTLGL